MDSVYFRNLLSSGRPIVEMTLSYSSDLSYLYTLLFIIFIREKEKERERVRDPHSKARLAFLRFQNSMKAVDQRAMKIEK